ncbi:MAG TPA: VOC family protein [Bacteroidia bacterium]|jgi:catechol 2,3-dioxygenase-like lactoylglutathione lyase family enzyme
MKFLQIKETCIYVKDLQQSYVFYHEMLELEMIGEVKDRHIFFRAGASVLLCFIAEQTLHHSFPLPPHGAHGQIHFAFEVEVLEYEKTKIEFSRKNISIEHEQQWKNGLHSFYFRDPDGHLLEVAQKGIWG